MSNSIKRLSIATAAAALLATSAMTINAQDPSLDEHHPAGEAAKEPQAAKPDAAPTSADVPTDTKKGGGMMGDGHMPKMMKMMQDMHGKMMGGGMPMQPKGDAGPSSLAFNGIMLKMHKDMAITYSGNADADFVKGMIPHHQAAIDMAKTVLAFGKDDDVKEMAEEVIKAQEKEIANMTEWLKKQGG